MKTRMIVEKNFKRKIFSINFGFENRLEIHYKNNGYLAKASSSHSYLLIVFIRVFLEEFVVYQFTDV